MKLASALLLAAALSGCSIVPKSSEPAIPSSKAGRSPINLTGNEQVAPPRNFSSEAHPESRIRRAGPVDVQPEQEDFGQSPQRYPLTTRYVHGASTPIIVCALGHLCDVELQPGEKVIPPIRTGDRARWQLDVAMSGQGGNQVPHLTLMPLEAGIETSIMVITDKRTYHMFLRASRTDSMLRTVFLYPDDMAARWNATDTPSVSVK